MIFFGFFGQNFQKEEINVMSLYLKTHDVFDCLPFSSLPILRHFDTPILPTPRHFNSINASTLQFFCGTQRLQSGLPGLITQRANLAVSHAHYFLALTFIIDQAFLTLKFLLLCIALFPGCSLLHVKSCGHDLLEEGVL